MSAKQNEDQTAPSASPISAAKRGRGGRGTGARIQVAVLFSDLSGFTELSEHLDPEQVRAILYPILDHIQHVVRRYGGVVEKFIGDAVVATFGNPNPMEDDAHRALKTAMEIHDFMTGYHPETGQHSGLRLNLHTAINHGDVVVGEYAGISGMVGSMINIASRLCDLAAPGEILVGEGVYRRLRNEYQFDSLAPRQVQGIRNAIPVYRLAGVGTRTEPDEPFMIGRRVELARLMEAMDETGLHRSSIIGIQGEAGMGKSLLLSEMRKALRPDVLWLEGRAYEFMRNTTLAPLVNMLNRLWAIGETDPREMVREKVEQNMRAMVARHAEFTPYIASLYGLEYPELRGQDPEQWKRNVFRAALEISESVSSQGPCVYVFQDIQWADAAFLELLQYVLTRTRAGGLILCTYRPPFDLFRQPGTDPLLTGHFHRIVLEGLPPAQIRQYVQERLGSHLVPEGLEDFLHEMTQGNPFYMEGMLDALIGEGTLKRKGDEWRLVGDMRRFPLPPGIKGVIGARVGRLVRNQRRVLEEASVIGREFHIEELRHITTVGQDVQTVLEELEEQRFVRPTGGNVPDKYVFNQPLAQEVVYESILHEERPEIHDRVGRAIEQVHQHRLSEHYERLASHFSLGNNRLSAVHYLARAGEKAQLRHALAESRSYFEQGYTLLTSSGISGVDGGEHQAAMLDLLNQWAVVHYYTGDFHALAQLLERHAPMVEHMPDSGAKGMFFSWLGAALTFSRNAHESHTTLRKAGELGEAAGDDLVVAYACSWLALNCAVRGEFSEGLRHGNRAIALSESFADDHYLSYNALIMTSINHWLQGHVGHTRAFGERLLDFGREHGNPRGTVMGRWMLSIAANKAGDFQLGLDIARKGLEDSTDDPMYRELSDLSFCTSSLLNGQPLPGLGKGFQYFTDKKQRLFSGYAGGFYAMGLFLNGQLNEALKVLKQCARESALDGYRPIHAHHLTMLGKMHMYLVGRHVFPPRMMVRNRQALLKMRPFAARKAEGYLKEAIDHYHQMGAYGYEGQTLFDLGNLFRLRGKKEQARRFYAQALPLLEQSESDVYLMKTRQALQELDGG